jgi:hypothetical protein
VNPLIRHEEAQLLISNFRQFPVSVTALEVAEVLVDKVSASRQSTLKRQLVISKLTAPALDTTCLTGANQIMGHAMGDDVRCR